MLVSATDTFCDSNKEVTSGNSPSAGHPSRSPQPHGSFGAHEAHQQPYRHHSVQHKGKNHRSSTGTPAKSIFDIFNTAGTSQSTEGSQTYTASSGSWPQRSAMTNPSTSSHEWRSQLFDSDLMFPNQLNPAPGPKKGNFVSSHSHRSSDMYWSDIPASSAISHESAVAPKYSYGFDADIFASTARLLNDESYADHDPRTQRPQYPGYGYSAKLSHDVFPPQLGGFGANWNRLDSVPTSQMAPAPITPRQLSPNYAGNESREKIVPSRNQIDVWKISQGYDNRTTFMIRNIPNRYTQKMLLECLDETHKGEYDFVYLRMDFKNHCNVGYAFINFIDVGAVLSFIEKRVGRKWSKFNSDKICHLSYANIQGKAALIEKFRNSSVMEKDPSYRPKIFYSTGSLRGVEEPFPVPGKAMTTNDKPLTESFSLANRTTAQHIEYNHPSSVLVQQQPTCTKSFNKLDWKVDWQEFDSDTDSGISNSLEDSLDTSFANLSVSCVTPNHAAGPIQCKK